MRPFDAGFRVVIEDAPAQIAAKSEFVRAKRSTCGASARLLDHLALLHFAVIEVLKDKTAVQQFFQFP